MAIDNIPVISIARLESTKTLRAAGDCVDRLTDVASKYAPAANTHSPAQPAEFEANRAGSYAQCFIALAANCAPCGDCAFRRLCDPHRQRSSGIQEDAMSKMTLAFLLCLAAAVYNPQAVVSYVGPHLYAGGEEFADVSSDRNHAKPSRTISAITPPTPWGESRAAKPPPPISEAE
jgi:hypothetical protein